MLGGRKLQTEKLKTKRRKKKRDKEIPRVSCISMLITNGPYQFRCHVELLAQVGHYSLRLVAERGQRRKKKKKKRVKET